MRAMILAAGLGSRLAPITQTIPKPLIPVVGTPNIVLTLMRLKKAGITEIVINTHWLAARLKHALGNGEKFGVDITYSDEPKLLGTGGGIRRALPFLGDEFIVINGDVLFSPNIESLIGFHRKHQAAATLVVQKISQKYATVGVAPNGRIRKLLYGGQDSPELSYYMFTGVHILTAEIFDHLPQTGCIVRKTYIPMMEENRAIYALEMNGYFCDLGDKERYLEANISLVNKEVSLSDLAIPQEGIYIGERVSVHQSATIDKGVIICDDVTIDREIYMKNAIALEGAHIHTDVTNAIVTSDDRIISCNLNRK